MNLDPLLDWWHGLPALGQMFYATLFFGAFLWSVLWQLGVFDNQAGVKP